MANKGNIPWNKGKKTGKPAHNSLNIDRDELYDLYINKKWTSEEIVNKYNCSSKAIRNWLKRYEIPIRSISNSVKLERSKWSDEKELERSRKYHNTWELKSQEEKDAAIKKRMQSPNINSLAAIKLANETRVKNGSTNTSKSEEAFKNKLLLLGIDKDDIIHPYINDPRYPFNCDYYIKSKDLFIEYQGHQSHGFAPFNENNEQHINYLIKMQDKGEDMTTWFKRDPYKLNVALNNKIKLLLIYPKQANYLIKDGKIITIDINDINKI